MVYIEFTLKQLESSDQEQFLNFLTHEKPMDLTRRKFVKVSGVLLVSGLFPIFPGNGNVCCPVCNARNLCSNKRCVNCGWRLTDGLKCYGCTAQSKCLSIPFPNHKYLIGSDKPILSLKEINL